MRDIFTSNFIMSTEELTKKKTEHKTIEDKENQIILYNDHENTFDHVIDMLVMYCDHSYIQAEQCAMIVHQKGKYAVKTGSYDDLEPRCTCLLEAGLTAEIV